jgi:hypothetical protein
MRSRLLGATIAGVIAAGAVQVAVAAPAAAAPATCTGAARVYLTKSDGTLWLYDHHAPATGAVSWSAGRQIGAGFQGPTASGPDGVVYWVNSLGELRRYRYDGTRWTEGGTLIGTGWRDVYDRRHGMTVDARGRLLFTDRTGMAWLFDDTLTRWDAGSGKPMAAGWPGAAVAAGDNVYYERDGGLLYRWRHDPAAQRFTRSDAAVGAGFGAADDMFSPGGDVLYRKVANGDLYWYRYDADTGTWANNGVGRLVGNGWNGWSVTAGTGTCTIPAPAAVGAVTPAPRDPSDAWQGTGFGDDFGFLFLGDHGGLMQFNAGRPPYGYGQQPLATTPSAATGERKTLAGLDSSGTAWISQGRPELPQFGEFGRGFTKVAVSGSLTNGNGVQALAADASGGLWWRREYPGGTAFEQRWTPWQRVLRDADLRGFSTFGAYDFSSSYGTAAVEGSSDDDYWFVLRDADQGPVELTGKIPAAAEVDHPSVFAGPDNQPTLVARMKSDGQPYLLRGNDSGFAEDTWVALPPLSADGSVTVDSAIGVDEVYGSLVVTLRGSDGHVYVTNQESGDEFYAWQQFPAAANTPAVSDEAGVRARLGFLGTDGRYYQYVSEDGPTTAVRLTFTGGAV